MLRHASLAGIAVALCACAEMGVETPLVARGDACGAAERQDLVGQRVDVLNDAALPEDARVLFPGSVATMDERPDRLNLTIGTDDTITAVACG